VLKEVIPSDSTGHKMDWSDEYKDNKNFKIDSC